MPLRRSSMRRAEALILPRFRQLQPQEIERKSPSDPHDIVTIVDRQVEEWLTRSGPRVSMRSPEERYELESSRLLQPARPGNRGSARRPPAHEALLATGPAGIRSGDAGSRRVAPSGSVLHRRAPLHRTMLQSCW